MDLIRDVVRNVTTANTRIYQENSFLKNFGIKDEKRRRDRNGREKMTSKTSSSKYPILLTTLKEDPEPKAEDSGA